jgi:glycolate oxidase iron-sulfur subunit
MQTKLSDTILQTPAGREADRILRSCVHCGFCTATCPTYQLLGDELDSPRGRIYQIKQVLEGEPATRGVQLHLDRCLTCRSCETTCPSGVHYARLLEIGREEVDRQVPRPLTERLLRRMLLHVIPYPRRFAPLAWAGSLVRGLLPERLGRPLPSLGRRSAAWPSPSHRRRMILFDGCAQPVLAPSINAATARVLDRLSISALRTPGACCCGALPLHLSEAERARIFARRNIDAWWPLLQQGAEAVLVSASACAGMIKEYPQLLAEDPDYADKAARVAGLCRDLSEVLTQEDLGPLRGEINTERRVAFHAPCTLQHGQGLKGQVEPLLGRLGFQLTPVPDSHLCCGSAGSYALLQPELSEQLRERKRSALVSGQPDIIATANIGCLTHLRDPVGPPVVHWIELLAARGN